LLNRTRRHASAGFTLIELLVAVAAMAFVIFYTLGTFTANRNTYVVIEQVSEAHQNTLAIAALVERDIRNAGYMVPSEGAACGRDNTNAPDVLFVSDTDAIQPADSLPSNLADGDLAAAVTGSIGTSWANGSTVTLSLDNVVIDGQPSYDTDATLGNDSDFRPQGGIIVFDANDPSKGVGCGIVTAVNVAGDQVSVTTIAAPDLGAGTWKAVPAHVYQIVNGSLFRNGVLMARNVEDMQMAWFYDGITANGQVDANEYVGGPGTQLVNNALPGDDPTSLREIRISFVLRTAENDPANPNDAGVGQLTENQTVAPGVDGRRRRVHTSTIRLRNLVP